MAAVPTTTVSRLGDRPLSVSFFPAGFSFPPASPFLPVFFFPAVSPFPPVPSFLPVSFPLPVSSLPSLRGDELLVFDESSPLEGRRLLPDDFFAAPSTLTGVSTVSTLESSTVLGEADFFAFSCFDDGLLPLSRPVDVTPLPKNTSMGRSLDSLCAEGMRAPIPLPRPRLRSAIPAPYSARLANSCAAARYAIAPLERGANVMTVSPYEGDSAIRTDRGISVSSVCSGK